MGNETFGEYRARTADVEAIEKLAGVIGSDNLEKLTPLLVVVEASMNEVSSKEGIAPVIAALRSEVEALDLENRVRFAASTVIVGIENAAQNWLLGGAA
jgi:hypothetical protein